MFNVRQPLALLVAAFDQFSEGDRASFARLLRAVTVVALRYNVICSRQSNEQEAVYDHIAVAISERRINGAGAAIGDLRSVYPDDAAFRAAFADKSLLTTSSRNKQVARFILFFSLSGNYPEAASISKAPDTTSSTCCRNDPAMTGISSTSNNGPHAPTVSATLRCWERRVIETPAMPASRKSELRTTTASSPAPASLPRITIPGTWTRFVRGRRGWRDRPGASGESSSDRSRTCCVTRPFIDTEPRWRPRCVPRAFASRRGPSTSDRTGRPFTAPCCG